MSWYWVDPYYLAEKAKELNLCLKYYQVEIPMIVAEFIGKEIIKDYLEFVMSFFRSTFKENVPDLRNSKSLELVRFLEKRNLQISLYDPFISELKDFEVIKNENLKKTKFDAIILSVPHKKILLNFKKNFLSLLTNKGILFDIKGKFRNKKITNYWSL